MGMRTASFFFAVGCLASVACSATYYVDSGPKGSDTNDGLSEGAPWKSIGRLSVQLLSAGDTVKFARGGVWRETLVPCSGDEANGAVTYTWYGDEKLPKPMLTSSIERNDPSMWTRISGTNQWTTGEPKSLGGNALPNPSFDSSTTSDWYTYAASPASAASFADAVDFDTAPASMSVGIVTAGSTPSSIQVFTYKVNLSASSSFILTFRAKASKAGNITAVSLHQISYPYASFGTFSKTTFSITTSWQTFTTTAFVTVKSPEARLTFSIGNAFPSGTNFHIDTLKLEPVTGLISGDVGNIIFNNRVGADKEWTPETVTQDRQFSSVDGIVTLYCTENPATHYDDIELAITRHIINEGNKHHVTYDGLDLRYTGAHGIGGGNTHHITARNLDMLFIGGGRQYDKVRYGNAIEFWCDAHDNLVEKCEISEVYDAALTNQCQSYCTQENIVYRYNIIRNSEYCFEYWNRPANSTTKGIRFENNACLYSGFGFGHYTRPDVSGRHLCFYSNPAATTGFQVINNIFYMAVEAATTLWSPTNWYYGATIDNNLYLQQKPYGSTLFLIPGKAKIDDFGEYVNFTHHDKYSIFADPKFTDVSAGNLRLLSGSPAIDSGLTTGAKTDFLGNPVPSGLGQDIGPFEFQFKSQSSKMPEGTSGSCSFCAWIVVAAAAIVSVVFA